MRESVIYYNIFIEKEFGIADGIESIEIIGKKRKDIAVVKLRNWETKAKGMREKRKLEKRRIYIEHDMTREERDVQRVIRDRANSGKKGKKIKIG